MITELTVLLVEDDEEQRELMRERLVDRGYLVLEADNLQQAKTILQRHRRIIDRVLCDNILGDRAAGTLIRERCEEIGVPCILMSGWRTGLVDLEKPIHWPSLIERLELPVPA